MFWHFDICDMAWRRILYWGDNDEHTHVTLRLATASLGAVCMFCVIFTWQVTSCLFVCLFLCLFLFVCLVVCQQTTFVSFLALFGFNNRFLTTWSAMLDVRWCRSCRSWSYLNRGRCANRLCVASSALQKHKHINTHEHNNTKHINNATLNT